MKNTLKAFLSATSVILASTSAFAGSDPSIAKIKVYGVAVSTSADCSSPKVIGYNSAGTTYDLMTNPALVSGTVDAGTYNCVILYMDAALTFTPAAGASGSCVAGTSYSRVLCTSAGGGCSYTDASPDASNILQYTGTTASAATSSTDTAHTPKVLLFLSTSSTGNGNTAFQRPVAGSWTNGLPLSGAFTVGATGTSATFVINFTGKVDGGGGTCDLQPPTFGFR